MLGVPETSPRYDSSVCATFGAFAYRHDCFGELFTWAYRRSNPQPTLDAITNELLPQVKVLVFDQDSAQLFGKTRAAMLNRGHSIDGIDLEIAVTALNHDLTLITNNTSDFRLVPNLRLIDWLVP